MLLSRQLGRVRGFVGGRVVEDVAKSRIVQKPIYGKKLFWTDDGGWAENTPQVR
jgi:hypothetical protein